VDEKQGPKPKLDRAIQDRIGRELREMYAELFGAPLPQNLLSPLRALDEVEASRQRLSDTLEAMRAAAPECLASAAPPQASGKRNGRMSTLRKF
jgi:hypothetical protein